MYDNDHLSRILLKSTVVIRTPQIFVVIDLYCYVKPKTGGLTSPQLDFSPPVLQCSVLKPFCCILLTEHCNILRVKVLPFC